MDCDIEISQKYRYSAEPSFSFHRSYFCSSRVKHIHKKGNILKERVYINGAYIKGN